MEITLEQIDLIRQRTGTGYKEAREALEAAGGNLVDALVMMENNGEHCYAEQHMTPPAGTPLPGMQEQEPEPGKGKKGQKMGMVKHNKIVSGLADLSRRSKIKITLPGERKVEIPAVLGLAGVVLAPKVAALSGMALLLAKSSLAMDYSGSNGQGPEAREDNS